MPRIMSLAMLLVLSLGGIAVAADDFTFVIMSDRTGGANQPVFERAVAEIALLHPDFVVTVGDLIQGYAANDVRTKQWDEVLPLLRRIGCPVYYTPGNHDIGDVESARLFFERTDRPPYYSFNKGSSHFIVLNTALFESYDQVDPAQRRWLEQDLLLNQLKSHIFVFMHKTFWVDGTAPDPASDPMHQLFKKYHVTAVFCGHGHSYVSQVIDGIRYAEIGATGADVGTPNVSLGVFNQYAIARIQGKEFNYAIAEVGHLYEPDMVSPADLKLSAEIGSKYIRVDTSVRDGQKIKQLPVAMTVINITDKAIQDTVRWTVPANWELKNTAYPLTVKPGDSTRLQFELKSKGAFYPLPTLRFTYPMGNGKHLDYDRIVNVTRMLMCGYPYDGIWNSIHLDGKLDETSWKKAETIKDFCGFDGASAKTDPTAVKFVEDDSFVYFSAVCKDSFMDKVKATLVKRDDPVHQDDCIGCMIASGDGKTIYQFYVNALGTLWDQKIDPTTGKTDLSWNMDCEVKTAKSDDAWYVEMKIRKTNLGIQKWKMQNEYMTRCVDGVKEVMLNIRRKQVRNGESAFWMPDWGYDISKYGLLELNLRFN